MKVRVFQNPDGSLQVVSPNPKYRNSGESDDAFIERIVIGNDPKQLRDPMPVLEADPSLRGLPTFDVDITMFPPRIRPDAQGDDCPCRNAWRRNGNAVEIDDTKIPPNYSSLHARLNQAVAGPNRKNVRQWLRDIRFAVSDKDINEIQDLYDDLKTLMASGNPPLGQAEFDVVQLTFQEKRIPIVL